MLDWAGLFGRGSTMSDFLTRYGTDEHRRRWASFDSQVVLTPEQLALLGSFRRQMHVLCVAGAWCGDCVNQCPILARFASACPVIDLRFVDRDSEPSLAALSICGGQRVPVVAFLSEDDQFVALFGDRTLARYRHLAATQLGASCPTGLVPEDAALTAAVTQGWLDEFERAQLLLRLSARLRQIHGD